MTINLKNLLNPNTKTSKMGDFQELKRIEGLSVSAVSADLYGDGRDDLSLFYFKDGAKYAALYTKSNIVSESIHWNLKVKNKSIKALLVNTKKCQYIYWKTRFSRSKKIVSVTIKMFNIKIGPSTARSKRYS